MDDLELEMLVRERGEETLRRLHRLVRHGYVATIGEGDVEDAILLSHLAGGPNLVLYGDGKLVATNNAYAIHPTAHDNGRIYNEDAADAEAFDWFLRQLRKPNWWQRGKPARDRYIIIPGCMIVMLAAMYALVLALFWLVEAVTGWDVH